MEEIVNSPPEVNKNCKLCGVVLKTGRKNFCSYAHKWEWQNNRWLINCNQCGVQFMLKKGQRSHFRKFPNANHFHNKECWLAWWKVNSKIIRNKTI